MKPTIKILNTIFILIIATYSQAYGEGLIHHDTANHDKKNTELNADGSSLASLSPELRALLSKEMVAIEQGMMAIIPAYVSGSWSEIEQIAQQIKNSYILKQSLTDHQLHELHSSLPEGFIKQDQHFHYLSGMLEHAASNKKAELVGFYFSKISESCLSCHSQYATHRFPALTPNNKATEHLH